MVSRTVCLILVIYSNFLPQERVHSFAQVPALATLTCHQQLSPHDLLVETIRTVGGTKMLDDYETLIAFRKDETKMAVVVDEETKEIGILNARNEQVSVEVQRFMEREKILQHVGDGVAAFTSRSFPLDSTVGDEATLAPLQHRAQRLHGHQVQTQTTRASLAPLAPTKRTHSGSHHVHEHFQSFIGL